jgi:drug/metabolite transporter (DMT)-like permease
MLEPVVAAVVAWVWLEQVLNGVQLVGGALVLLGVGLVQTARSTMGDEEDERLPVPVDAPL